MNALKKVLVFGGVVVVGVLFGFMLGRFNAAPVASDPLAGQIHNTQESFDEGIAVDGTQVIGGSGEITPSTSTRLRATVFGDSDAAKIQITNATSLLTNAQICNNSYFVYSDMGVNATSQVPTAANMISGCLTRFGDYREFYVNVSSTNAITLAENTSSSIYMATTTRTLVIPTSTVGVMARITAIRVATSGATGDPWVNYFVTPFR